MFVNYFFNVDSFITTQFKEFKFCLLGPHTHSEGTTSQIFDLCLSFYFMSKNGKHLVEFVYIIFPVT